MREIFQCVIPGEPTAKQSAKFRTFEKNGKTRGHSYQPAKVVNWEAYCKKWIAEAWGGKAPIDIIPLIVTVEFIFYPPKSLKAAQRKLIQNKQLVRKMTKPDCGNLEKPITDALEGIVVTNDSRFAETRISKWYGIIPSTLITIAVDDNPEAV